MYTGKAPSLFPVNNDFSKSRGRGETSRMTSYLLAFRLQIVVAVHNILENSVLFS